MLRVVLNTIKPAEGDGMRYIWVVDILGGRKPLLVDFTSSIAEGSGEVLSLLIPTWAKITLLNNRKAVIKKVNVFMEEKNFSKIQQQI